MNTRINARGSRAKAENTPFRLMNGATRASANGVALIITLSILVLVTIIVVAYVTVVRLEGTSARSNFENQRAKAFAMMAVDDVTATLVDNIPVTTTGSFGSQWAVGPGQLYVTAPAGTSGTAISYPLHSGIPTPGANPTPGTCVALNAPGMSTATGYPIAPPNTTNYAVSGSNAAPNSMVVNWINVLQNGTRVSGTVPLSTGTANAVVGRYAYWTDVETCKVNLNTAGRGNVQLVPSTDNQNYGGMPSRVDLSYLDPSLSGTINEAESQATYAYTAGVPTAALNPAYPANPATPPHRYNSIAEWSNTSNFNTANYSPCSLGPFISGSQVTANQFYLTTQARAPELNPWGLNKVWWENYPPENPGLNVTNSGSNGNFSNSFLYGQGGFVAPAVAPAPYDFAGYPDYRYYVYPWVENNWTADILQGGASNPTGAFQMAFQAFTTPEGANSSNELMSGTDGSVGSAPAHQNFDDGFDAFFLSLYNQLSRADWPGMPAGQSFVSKYGTYACENIAVNTMFMMDSTLGSDTDNVGKCVNYRRPVTNPWINKLISRDQLGIYGMYLWDSPLGTIDPNTKSSQLPNGEVRKLWGNGPWPYVVEISLSLVPTTASNIAYLTPHGFVGSTGTAADGNKMENMYVYPFVRAVWPKGMFGYNNSNFLYSGGNAPKFQIKMSQFYCTGTATTTGSAYTFSRLYKTDPYNGGSAGVSSTTPAVGYGYSPGTSSTWTPDPSSPGNYYGNFPLEPGAGWPIIIGPFPTTGKVNLTFSFRIATCGQGQFAGNAPLPFQNIPTTALKDPTTPPLPGETLTFPASVSNWGTPGTSPVSVSKVIIDPRVCQSASNWITYPDPNAATPCSYFPSANGSKYKPNNTSQGHTGMDYSKFAWPPILNLVKNKASAIHQNATSVTDMPGLGWLSLVSTADYYKYNPGATTPIDQNWLTLDFGPATSGTSLPDWLMMDIFAMAYDQSYCSQTEGKINPNADIFPFSQNYSFVRLNPLEALIGKGTSDPNPNPPVFNAPYVAQNILKFQPSTSSASGGGAATFPGLPSKFYVYPGQICQIAGVSDTATSGTNQFDREALIRDIGGLITTQSSDFKVHVVAQSVKQVANDLNPNDLKVLAQQQLEADLERTVDLGPDGVPGTGDDNIAMDGTIPIYRPILELSGTPPPLTSSPTSLSLTSSTTPLTYPYVNNVTIPGTGKNDPMLIGGAGQPPFCYRVSSFKYLNQ